MLLLAMTTTLLFGGGTYYVGPGGSNGASGLTHDDRWATLQHAADTVSAGDVVLIDDGNYAGFEVFTSGSAAEPILFQAVGDSAIVDTGANGRGDLINVEDADYCVIDGLTATNAPRSGIAVLGTPTDHVLFVKIQNCVSIDNGTWGIFTGYAEDIVIEGNRCSGSGDEHGIYVSNSADRPIILDNTVFGNNASGIQINADPALAGDGIISNAVIARNIIYDNGSAGGGSINLASVRDSTIINNLIFNNRNTGIATWDDGFDPAFGCRDNLIANNTVVMPADGRWACSLINGSTGNEIRNNILLHQGIRGGLELDTTSLAGLISDTNVIQKISDDDVWIDLATWQASHGMAFDQSSVSAGPTQLFVDPGLDDYHLSDTSPARNAGSEIAQVSDDLDHNARPSEGTTDIGCYEYGASPNLCGTSLSAYFTAWRGPPQPPDAIDSNNNALIDVVDVVEMVNCLASP